jgi:putative transposase
MQCLLHAIKPKSYVKSRFPGIVNPWCAYGIPEVIVVDNGREFHSKSFEDACYQLGSQVLYAPIRHAWYKGSVERYFGTLNQQLLHSQPGTTFSNIFERGDYDSSKNALITFKVLEEIVHTYIIDVYHQSPHRGISDVPAKVWDASMSVYPPALPRSSKDLEVLVGLSVRRTLTGKGIEFKGLFFNDSRLSQIRRRFAKGTRKVQIKVNPTDLSGVYVLDEMKREYLQVPAVNQEYARGLTLWQHKVIVDYARSEVENYVDMVALRRAKEQIGEIVVREWNATKSHQTRQRLARLVSYGQVNGEMAVAESLGEPVEEAAEGPALLPVQVDEGRAGLSDLGSALDSSSVDPTPPFGGQPEAMADQPDEQREQVSKRRRGRPRKEESVGAAKEDTTSPGAMPFEISLDEEGWTGGYDLPR